MTTFEQLFESKVDKKDISSMISGIDNNQVATLIEIRSDFTIKMSELQQQLTEGLMKKVNYDDF